VDPELDYDRLFRGVMGGAGLDVLWVVDSLGGEIVATGHRRRVLGRDGTELTRQAREARDRAFLVTLGSEEHQRFLVHACTIARGGARLSIVGGHRLPTLRSLDPDQVAIAGGATDDSEVIAELADSKGVVQAVVLWRPRVDRRAPPLLLWIACVALVGIGLAVFFGGYLNRWLQSSVDELTAAATRVGGGDLQTTLRDDGGGAFPATATAFNRMTRDLRSARAELRRTERVAAWQEIARSLAHELKNPLSPIRLSIETLRKAHARSHEEFDALFDESTRTILHEVDRLRNIVDEFSRFARLPAPTLRRADLRETVSRATSLHGEGPATLRAHLPSAPVYAFVDPDQITQVLHNLLQNARDAVASARPDGGGTIAVGLEETEGAVYVRVEDDGPGISADRAEAIFEPYHTGKQGGTGLGLAITQRIVAEHGGRIEVDSRPGRTVFTVVLPR
jgi:signal transduction histidine kinase